MTESKQTKSLAEVAKVEIIDPIVEHPAAKSLMKGMGQRPYLATWTYFNTAGVVIPLAIYTFFIAGVAIFSLAAAALFVLFWAAVALIVLVPSLAAAVVMSTILWAWAVAIYKFLSLFIELENPFKDYADKDSDIDGADEDFGSRFPRQDIRPFARPRIPDPSNTQNQSQTQLRPEPDSGVRVHHAQARDGDEDENASAHAVPIARLEEIWGAGSDVAELDRTTVTQQQQQQQQMEQEREEDAADAPSAGQDQRPEAGSAPNPDPQPEGGNLRLNGDVSEGGSSQRTAHPPEEARD